MQIKKLNKFEYAVVLVSILSGIEYSEDNYENFCCIVDDVINLKIEDKKPADVYRFFSGIYIEVDDSISYDFMDELCDSCMDYTYFGDHFYREKNKVEYKIKGLFKKR